MDVFNIKRGSTLPKLRCEIVDEDGERYEIDNAVSVTFRMYDDDSNLLIENPAEMPNDFTLQYSWADGETDLPDGIYYGEFEIVLDTGEKLILPTNGWISIVIRE